VLAMLLALWVAPSPLTDPDAYAVYAAVIPSQWPVEAAHATRLVIQDTTEIAMYAVRPCYPEGPDIKGPWEAALTDFKQQNTQSWALMQQFPLAIPYDLVRRDDLEEFFKARGILGWDDFNAAHPDAKGYIQMSAVGFDTTKMKAIVFVAHHCGGLCGAGQYHFLERQQDRWTEVRPNVRACSWVS
jgi:hypothetical protein